MNKRIKSFEEGFGTAYTFIIILFASIIFIGLAYLIINSRNHISFDSNIESEVLSQDIAEQIINSMLEDNTPESDSLIDPVWALVSSLNTETVAITLTDLSSRINPNFFRDEIVDETNISKLIFADGHSMAELEQYRSDNTITADLQNGYPEFFSEDGIEFYLSSYSYFNINIADELALTDMYVIRTENESASESFRSKIRQSRTNKTIIYNNEIENIAGSAAGKIYPFINAVPVMNIHLIPEELLSEILSYDFGDDKLKYPEKSFNQIIQKRTNGEIGIDELESIFSVKDEKHLIFDYLGTKTWFWEITISLDDCKRTVIVAELPDKEYSYKPRDAASKGNIKRTLQIISNLFYNEQDL